MSLHYEILRSTDRFISVLKRELCTTENKFWILIRYGEADVLLRGEHESSWVYVMKAELLLECSSKLRKVSNVVVDDGEENAPPRTCTVRKVVRSSAKDSAYHLSVILEELTKIPSSLVGDGVLHEDKRVFCLNCAQAFNNTLGNSCKHVDKTHTLEEVRESINHLQTIYVHDIYHCNNTHPDPAPLALCPDPQKPMIRDFESILSCGTRRKLGIHVGTTLEWLGAIIEDEVTENKRKQQHHSWRIKNKTLFSSSPPSLSTSSACQDRLNRNIQRVYKNLLTVDTKASEAMASNEKSSTMFKVNMCHILSMITNAILHRKLTRKRPFGVVDICNMSVLVK